MINRQSQHTTSPRLVTTGGNYPLVELVKTIYPPIAHIDWLSFTVKFTEAKELGWLVQELRQFIPRLTLTPTGKGWNGYKERHNITCADFDGDLGLIAHGGDNQRGTASIQLNAQACSMITDWQALKTWCEPNATKITRLDLAHDDMTGKVLTIAKGIQWLQDGLFSNNGAREGATAVKGRLIDDLGSGDGKTLYIGNRKSGKMLRIYEKGKQLGDKLSTWVRAEVELKDKDRVIPWDALVNPSHYLAAAYPCLNYLSAIQHKIKTIKKAVNISIDTAVHHLRNMGGMLINVLMQKHYGDAFLVVNELKREGIPKRLASYAAHLPTLLHEVRT
ncbi:MAG: replication initiation factor domain-containing protein [Methylotenera sp.]|nr:replication initiation factor domain-containing protein [Methylotenera sp.]MDP2403780.1 replication initiation factor domain-containing protein [Methylotenera sp.]MDP3086688.1 replication initiation factor domain-containing protein [Methylotenera sp.]MDP3095166.1 replication initiation factor domain-containing protein [Methylotenera sp.]MDP3303877.1 replication initiation factor domain-containing protein [Methylotenera sp.]